MTASTDQSAPHAIEARGIRRTFKMGGSRLSVLDGVDLVVEEGEFTAVRGSSGAGKSTLLHILGLLDRPDEGTLLIGGEDLSRASERRRARVRAIEVGFVFQDYYLLPEFTALENVLMPAFIASGRSRAAARGDDQQERASALLERVGLGDRMKHRPRQLSGGERQRVAIARALLNAPRVVFCDEPTGNLDSRNAGSIHDLLLELNEREQQTFLIVTHEADLAAIARRRLDMIDGRIVDEQEAEA